MTPYLPAATTVTAIIVNIAAMPRGMTAARSMKSPTSSVISMMADDVTSGTRLENLKKTIPFGPHYRLM